MAHQPAQGAFHHRALVAVDGLELGDLVLASSRGEQDVVGVDRHEYRLWRGRPLSERYVYVFADGLYLKAGQEREKTAVLVVIGVRADGQKELLAMLARSRAHSARVG
jgi:hypothetical protein